MHWIHVPVVEQNVTLVGPADRRRKPGDAGSGRHLVPPVENFHEDHSLHEIRSRKLRVTREAFSHVTPDN